MFEHRVVENLHPGAGAAGVPHRDPLVVPGEDEVVVGRQTELALRYLGYCES